MTSNADQVADQHYHSLFGANAGVMEASSLAVYAIAQVRGVSPKHAIKQVVEDAAARLEMIRQMPIYGMQRLKVIDGGRHALQDELFALAIRYALGEDETPDPRIRELDRRLARRATLRDVSPGDKPDRRM